MPLPPKPKCLYGTHPDTFTALFTEVALAAGWPDPLSKAKRVLGQYSAYTIGPANTATIIRALKAPPPASPFDTSSPYTDTKKFG